MNRQNRTISILVTIICILVVVLFIRMMIAKNNPTQVYNNIRVNNVIETSENINEYNKSTVNLQETEKYENINNTIERSMVSSISSPLIIAGAVLLLIIISFYRICIKLDIPIYIIVINAIALVGFIITLLSEFGLTTINVMLIIFEISTIILEMMMYSRVGAIPWLVLLVLIPQIGNIVATIVYIYGMWMLGTYFNKSTGFKVGLIFFGFVYLPALAFERE